MVGPPFRFSATTTGVSPCRTAFRPLHGSLRILDQRHVRLQLPFLLPATFVSASFILHRKFHDCFRCFPVGFQDYGPESAIVARPSAFFFFGGCQGSDDAFPEQRGCQHPVSCRRRRSSKQPRSTSLGAQTKALPFVALFLGGSLAQSESTRFFASEQHGIHQRVNFRRSPNQNQPGGVLVQGCHQLLRGASISLFGPPKVAIVSTEPQ